MAIDVSLKRWRVGRVLSCLGVFLIGLFCLQIGNSFGGEWTIKGDGLGSSLWSDFLLPESDIVSEAGNAEKATEFQSRGDSLHFSKDVTIRGMNLPSCRSFQIWGDYYVASGEIEPQDAPYSIDDDFNGAQIGLNLGLGSAFLVTAWYNYQRGEMGDGERTTKDETHLAGTGIRFNSGGLYFDLLGDFGKDSYQARDDRDGDRRVDYDGWQAGGMLETGYYMSTGGLFTLKPFGNVQYSYLSHDGIDRRSMTLREEKQKFDALFQTLGARIDMDLSLVTLQGRFGWIHQYLDASPINNYWFSQNTGTFTPTRTFDEGGTGRDYFWGGVGGSLSLFGQLLVTMDYDVLLNHYQTTHLGSVGLLWGF